MRGYYWGAGVVRCGFCGYPGHNITTCKKVDQVVSKALGKIEKNPSYIVDHDEHRALYEIKKRFDRKNKKPNPNRKKPRCSYCKSLNHKRPKCPELHNFKQMVYDANLNWKREFAHRVNAAGMGIGSLIGSYDGSIGLLSNYNLHLLNVFCALEDYSPYQNRVNFEVLVSSDAEEISYDSVKGIIGDDLFSQSWWQSDYAVISPVLWEPCKDWLEDPQSDSFEWFFKRINKHELDNSGITRFIEKWAKKV